MKNNKGVTLIELLVCLIILGIIIPFIGNLFLNLNRNIVKANKTITALSQKILDANAVQLSCTNTCTAPKPSPTPSPSPAPKKKVTCTGVVLKRRGNSDNYEMTAVDCEDD